MKQKTAARKYRAATTRMTACGPDTLMTSGPSRANPIANAALRVSVKTPFAASSCRRGTTSGIIAASAGAKNTVTVETKMLSSRMSAKLSPDEEQRGDRDAAQDVRHDEHEPPVDPVDVDAGDGAEQHGRHEERQDEQADRGVRLRLGDDDGQAEQDHVAADLGRRLRQPEAQERSVAEDGEGALGPRVVGGRPGRSTDGAVDGRQPVGSPPMPVMSAGPGSTAAVRAGSPRATNPTRRRSRVARSSEHVACAALAAQPDVGAETVDQPRVGRRTDARRRRRTTSPSSRVRTGRAGTAGGYQSRGLAGRSGRGRGRSPGRRWSSTGVTSTMTSGWVAASWAMIPPDRVSEPVSLSGGPMAASSMGSSAGTSSTVTSPAAPADDQARARPARRRWRWPRRRRCAAR